nr:MAG TPA: hypothetical protein [Caudoviricetes sp.]
MLISILSYIEYTLSIIIRDKFKFLFLSYYTLLYLSIYSYTLL